MHGNVVVRVVKGVSMSMPGMRGDVALAVARKDRKEVRKGWNSMQHGFMAVWCLGRGEDGSSAPIVLMCCMITKL